MSSPWNAFPSYHIASGWNILRYTQERLKCGQYLMAIWFIGMCIGTVTLKLHIILDGVAAIFIAELCYQLFKLPKIKLILQQFIALPRKGILTAYIMITLLVISLVIYQLIHIKPILIGSLIGTSSLTY